MRVHNRHLRIVWVLCLMVVGLIVGKKVCARTDYTAVTCIISSVVVYPIVLMQRWITEPLRSWLLDRHAVSALRDELVDLREKAEQLREENIALQSVRVYAQETDDLRQFSQRYDVYNPRIAHVLARSFDADQHYILVDKGSRDDVSVETIAVYKNMLVGRVTEVYPWYSKVKLLTDAGCSVGAQGVDSGVFGVYRGLNQCDHGVLAYVSHIAPIEPGELFISSGEGLIFPKGFGIGTVGQITTDGVHKHVTIVPLCTFEDIRYCMLLNKSDI